MTLVTLGELLDAGVHFGHQSSRWNPKMFPYIYTEQNGIHVIDLVQTARLLRHTIMFKKPQKKEKLSFLSEQNAKQKILLQKRLQNVVASLWITVG